MSKAKETEDAKKKRADDDLTSLTVKIENATRIHWLNSAKSEGATLSAVIVEFLTERYGLPKKAKK